MIFSRWRRRLLRRNAALSADGKGNAERFFSFSILIPPSSDDGSELLWPHSWRRQRVIVGPGRAGVAAAVVITPTNSRLSLR